MMHDAQQIDLPRGWAWATFGELTDNFDGRRVPVKAKDRVLMRGPYPYYGASGVIDSVDGYLFDGDYLLVTEDGNLLSKSHQIAFTAKGKFWVNNHAHVVHPLGDVPIVYLQHFINCTDLQTYVTGTTRPKLTQAALNRIPVPLPPLAEQRRIVAEIEKQFTRLDASVAALRRTQANLKRYRASVLRAACSGELVPTEAELARAEGREYEPAGVLLERILAERRAHWEAQEKRRGKYKEPTAPDTSDLPTLPEGWAWASFDALTRNFDGVRVPVKAEDRAEMQGSYPYYGASGVIDSVNNFLFDGRFLLVAEDGANLLSRSTPIAFIAHGQFWVNNHAHVVQTFGTLPLSYVENYINGLDLQRYVTGTAQPKLTQAALNRLSVPLPPLAEQRRIVAEVERRLSVIQQAEAAVDASLQRAERLRQSILKRAFSGELVPQDPDDEPASVLLERIRAQREAEQAAAATTKKRPARRRRQNPTRKEAAA